ncbi:histidine phosphatase family protein, partial [Micromonospora sp. NPDC023888]|uniref:histidine phosphatase family protein n=1 Tax=Micromonospora sp. NPDC023888 TaxID=3155607 RepID=UPI0033D018BB
RPFATPPPGGGPPSGAPHDGLDEGGLRAVRAQADADPGWRGHLGVHDTCLSSPAAAARQTAETFGLLPTIETALADCDYGDWAGRSLAEIAGTHPQALQEWLTTADSAPHGGESVAAVRDRVGSWLDEQRGAGRRIIAVTHPLVIRVAVVHALGLPMATYRQLDVEPLAIVRLTSQGTRWQFRLGAQRTA